MTLISKPMLADALEDVSQLKCPVIGSPKLDGIRCLKLDGKVVSRKFLDIPNNYIRNIMSLLVIEELDGELMTVNDDGSVRTFNQIQGDVMREDGTPNFQYHIFDYVSTSITEPYVDRLKKLEKLILPSFCVLVSSRLLTSVEEFEAYEAECLAAGYEGIMVRSVNGPYKCGRSSVKQGYLLKVKRFKDSEAEVIGFEELMHNENEAEQDAFGRTKRSKAQAGMVPAGSLGKFLVRETGNTPWNGQIFAIGTGEGLTQALRQDIWNNRDLYLGKTITYKYQPHGVKDLPRLPIWKGWRHKNDISE